jgi:DNA replication protein DnaC
VKQDAASQATEIQARYFKILNHCYERHISVVITSNLSIDQLQDHLGARCWSRLQEMASVGLILELGRDVPDYRLRRSGRG